MICMIRTMFFQSSISCYSFRPQSSSRLSSARDRSFLPDHATVLYGGGQHCSYRSSDQTMKRRWLAWSSIIDNNTVLFRQAVTIRDSFYPEEIAIVLKSLSEPFRQRRRSGFLLKNSAKYVSVSDRSNSDRLFKTWKQMTFTSRSWRTLQTAGVGFMALGNVIVSSWMLGHAVPLFHLSLKRFNFFFL